MLNNVPLPGNTLLGTRDQIAANFSNINTGFSVNHNELTLVGAGKHKYLQMPVQAGVVITAVTEVALYAKTGATSAIPELAFKRDSNPATDIVFTEFHQDVPGVGAKGWTRLPCGLYMEWGNNVTSGVTGLCQITLTNILTVCNVQVTAQYPGWNNLYAHLDHTGPNTIYIYGQKLSGTVSTAQAVNFQWFAIGS
jgi:hypothetical protein